MTATAILLAAGYATRLYPLTKDQPKALLPLASGTILDAIMQALEPAAQITRRILVTNARFAPQFRQWQRARGVDIEILDDQTATPETRLGAIRDLELARTQGRAAGDLLVIGTDNLFTWPVSEFLRQAERVRPCASVALWQAPSKDAAMQFGVVECEADGRIRNFVEKSPTPPSRAVALCVYYFPEPMLHRIRQFLEQGGNADAPGYFIQWLARTERVYGVTMPGLWYDIGTLEAYQQVVSGWKKGQQVTMGY